MSWLSVARYLGIPALAFVLGAVVNGWRLRVSHNEILAEQAAEHIQLLEQAQADLERKQRALADLDTRHTRELNNAKAEIERLADDLAVGRERLRVSATCEPVPSGGESSGVDHGVTPRLTDAAERDYLRLRQRISRSHQQILALQDYIRTQCQR